MKSKIKFFYNLFIDNIVSYEEYSIIESNNNVYILKKIYNTSSSLFTNNDYFEIISNNSGTIITEIDSSNFILMRVLKGQHNLYDSFEPQLTTINSNIVTSDLWIEKLEYLKKQLINFGQNKKILIQSFNYFCGMAENAISIMKQCEKKKTCAKSYLCHKRMYYPNNTINYFDPTNFIVDYKSRDVAEYIKSCFFKNKILPQEELRKIINNFKISSDDAEILFARMLFPTFYFDLFQQNVTTDSIDSSAFNKIIASIEQYKVLLNNIYNICFDQNKRTFYIDWILIDR